MKKRLFAASELTAATIIWGFGFVASAWALKAFDSASISAIRFSIGFLFGLAVLYIFKVKIKKADVMVTMGPGLLLGFTLGLQTWGIEHTSITNSGFITTLYVVFVPLFQVLLFKVKPKRIHYFWLLLALTGTALMVQLKFTSLNVGDVYTFLCSLTAAGQILWIARVQKHIDNAFKFNTFQSLWAFVATLIFWPIYGKFYYHTPDIKALLSLMSLVFGSTILAFALQVKAQKVLPANTASLIFLVESPFAAIFAYFLLGEIWSPLQAVGAVLILIAAYGSTRE